MLRSLPTATLSDQGDTDVQLIGDRMHFNETQHMAGEAGQAMVEYGALLALIFVAVMVFIPAVGDSVAGLYQTVRDALIATLP